jgi:ABC-type methionine transport system ATPase subunit
MTHEKKRYWLTFAPERTNQPLLSEMSRKFDLAFNVRDSNVTGTIGLVGLELEGPGPSIQQAVRWFKRKGIQVAPVELDIVEG